MINCFQEDMNRYFMLIGYEDFQEKYLGKVKNKLDIKLEFQPTNQKLRIKTQKKTKSENQNKFKTNKIRLT